MILSPCSYNQILRVVEPYVCNVSRVTNVTPGLAAWLCDRVGEQLHVTIVISSHCNISVEVNIHSVYIIHIFHELRVDPFNIASNDSCVTLTIHLYPGNLFTCSNTEYLLLTHPCVSEEEVTVLRPV